MDEQSYEPLVPEKVGNRRAPARGGHGTHWREGGEQGDVSAEGNIAETQSSIPMSPKLDRIAELAREDPQRQFSSLAHLVTPEALAAAFGSLRKEASAGVDGVTYQEYETDAERNIRQLHQRLKEGTYQPQPLRRIYIPKENGKRDRSRFPPSRTRSCRRRWPKY